MCLSAEVSFAASVFLVAGGAFTTSKATQINMLYLPVALMPLFAAIQQCMKSNVWMGVNSGDPFTVWWEAKGFIFSRG
ncbi:DUF6629 family protein [Sulfitobacter sp. MF3-043]|uniref:DUF6629 family protein n=1 Tax=Sulfitobacter sediminivivens TaxID=3252902 RepID=UPI0036DD28CD